MGASEVALSGSPTDDLAVERQGERRALSANDLYELVNPRPRFERQFTMRDAVREHRYGFLFSIDGTLRGEAITGALFADEAMLVLAPDFASALKRARDGVRETQLLLLQEVLTRESREEVNPLSIDTGGRRVNGSEPGQELSTDPKLRRMIEEAAGKPKH